MKPQALPEPAGWRPPRNWGRIGWPALWALYRRELLRYLRIAPESLGGALISSLLFLAVFTLAWPDRLQLQPGVSALVFLAPGIAGYALFHNAFENAAFGLLYDKLEGMLGDILMAPLTPAEILCAYVAAAATGGLITGSAVLLVLALFMPLPLPALLPVLAFAVLGTLFFALLGFLTGMWAEKWDRYAVVDTFLVMPLGMLSGSFFTPAILPETARWIMQVNPVFYLIDGFRSGFTGVSEVSPLFGFALGLVLTIGLGALVWRLLRRGWRVQS
ncbi:ABC transporter permease [Aquibaculum arenosum]|uniref:Transport permease protein n=1 Tax=Aquibaculum arenosum TaxID=3032591 RepID=A0ABT5YKL9_9PROT|nr:ABC transporter permease [Fodinicurvata sp. CAU 1616]MDF2095492.1 ABC transporter permease [Fodinicurvata sp. CAU 1616]